MKMWIPKKKKVKNKYVEKFIFVLWLTCSLLTFTLKSWYFSLQQIKPNDNFEKSTHISLQSFQQAPFKFTLM